MVGFVVEIAESFLRDVGVVSPPTKQVRAVNSCIHGQVRIRLVYSEKRELFGSLAFRRREAIELRAMLCAVLSFVSMMLVVSLVVWRRFSDSLSHLAYGYFAMRHTNNSVRQQCDTNNDFEP